MYITGNIFNKDIRYPNGKSYWKDQNTKIVQGSKLLLAINDRKKIQI